MIEIIGTELYQWDTGRSVNVTTAGATHVHFANQGDSKAVKMGLVNSEAKIPDYLLQTGKQLCVYAVANGVTIERKMFSVTKRERPEDYVYDEDQRNFIYALIKSAEEATEEAKRVAKELETARDNGEFTGPPGEKGEVNIDDAKVGMDAWSSKNIVDRMCLSFKSKGEVVRCEPVEGYPLEVTVPITCTQDEGGDPCSPGVGKNLYNFEKYPLLEGYYINHKKGTGSGSEVYAATAVPNEYGTGAQPLYIPFKGLAGKTITLNHTPGGANPGMAFYDADKVYISGGKGAAIVVPDNAEYMAFSVPIGYADGKDVQIEIGDTATEYEPYVWIRPIYGRNDVSVMHNGEKVTFDLGQEVYSGSLDFSTGKLTITTVRYVLTGDEEGLSALEFVSGTGRVFGYYDPANPFLQRYKKFSDVLAFSSHFEKVADDAGTNFMYRNTFKWIGGTKQVQFCCDPSKVKTLEDLRQYLAEQYARGTPVEFVCEVSTPIEVQLAPQEIIALSGINTLSCDTGDITVSGRADPVAVIEKLTNAIISLGGNV